MLHAANIDWSHHEQCDGYGERRLPGQQRGRVVPADAADVPASRRCRGKGDVHHHLENLGFVEGAKVSVVSEQAGNFIVEIKGASVALDKSVAAKIIVS